MPREVKHCRPFCPTTSTGGGYTLQAADEDSEYVERHRLRDKRRMEVNPALGDLVRAFASGQMSLADFKEQFDSKTRVEWEVLGLKGPAGAMFLNQVAKNVPDQACS